ncbi:MULTISPECIES: spermidine synthase [Cupriavidus]|uniref:Spermidine synthase n=1 Tax=Cupriavidus basilensis TaxID=68895 RepID=A0A643FY32_9BURK|nr:MULTISPECIES: spermidine synthase [Cupriavidus]MBB1635459.1 spermidine synthase [Cupriavidus sp. UME77]NUA31546.1 spermidine synthase [Cupriavidus basilensis]QOT75362.1 spermidine synthase [Cupriavidus basilensis]
MTLLKRKSIEAVASRRPARGARSPEDGRGARGAQAAQREEKRMTPRFAPVTFSEMDGVRYLHFGTEWVQGAMRLRKPDAIELEYAQQMMAWLLFLSPSAPEFHVTQLGLGAAALTKFCHRQFSRARVTAVELNPAVIIAGRSMFGLREDDERLTVREQDAWDYVMDGAHTGALDVLQVDLYDATARGPVLDTTAFYKACRRVLKAPGVMTINLFGDHDSFPKNIVRICEAFDNRVLVFPEVHDGNVIALAFNGPAIDVSWDVLEIRAKVLEDTTGLPAREWVKGLRAANANQEDGLRI